MIGSRSAALDAAHPGGEGATLNLDSILSELKSQRGNFIGSLGPDGLANNG